MPIKVLLNDSPLKNANAIRGIGVYTRFLAKYLAKNKTVDLSLNSDKNLDFKAEITHYPFFVLFFSTLPLINKGKTIVTIHDVIPLLFPKYYPIGKKGFLALVRQKVALKSVNAVITDSNSSKTDIAKYLKFPLEKIYVVPLAANPGLKPAHQEEIQQVIKKYKLPKKYLLYVGDINYNKNIPQLIKTLKFLPKEIHLVCVGKNFYPQDIPEWNAIETQIALSDVSKRIKFVTDLSSENNLELSAIYSDALAYLQASLYEGFGLPVLEAMRTGTPVICANNSSLSEVVLNKAIMVEEAKAENFALAVEEILTWSKPNREKFVKQAMAHANKFTWDKTVKATIAVYQDVLKK